MAHDAASSANPNDSDRVFRCHQNLLRLYSSSTRRSNSINSHASSIDLHNEQHISQNDVAVLQQKFQFLRDDNDDAKQGQTDWQVRMSVRYYRQLFREYALADLSQYKEGKIGLRWRTEMEVVAGKGQFSCGNKHCDECAGLHSYELLFVYVEHGERKQCLVKVRACSDCAKKLFYRKLEDMRRKKKHKRDKRERKRRQLEKSARDGRQGKRSRRSASYCDSDSSIDNGLDNANERKERRVVNDERIGKLCAKINTEQNAAYPRDFKQHRDEFDELLP